VVILLSALAVVAAAVLLVAWFVVGGGFTLIYAAMVLAVVSMVLLWAARWLGSSSAPPHPVAPSPLVVERPVSARVPHEPHVHVLAGDDEALEDEEVIDVTGSFPIDDYDHLWVTQILPLLHDLDADQLAMVEARERGGRHRNGVLDALQAERAGRNLTTAEPAQEPVAEPAPEPDPEPTPELDPWLTEPWGEDGWSEADGPEGPAAPVEIDAVKVDPVVVDEDDHVTLDGSPTPEPVVAAAGAPRVRTFLGRPAGPITIRWD
jgi:hypothetical protein